MIMDAKVDGLLHKIHIKLMGLATNLINRVP